MSVLLVIEGMLAGRRFNLRQRTRIGRALDNEIALPDHQVSRYHAEIVRDGMDYVLRDLGSKNRLTVNRAETAEHRLCRGDVVQIGKSRFLFEVPAQAHAARFSERTVRLEPVGDEGIRLITPAALPVPSGTEELALLVRFSKLFNCPPDALPEALNDILRRVMEPLGAAAAALLLRNGTGDSMPLVAVADQPELFFSHDAVNQVLTTGKAALAAALVQDGGQPRLHPRRAIVVPLLRGDRVFGALALQRFNGKDFATEDLGLVQVLAGLISAAVHHAVQVDQVVVETTGSTQSSGYVGGSPAARSVRGQIRRIAANDATVLLTGETGTGKELVARAIHAASPRAAERFVAIDCSAIPASLIESELFGHEAGAFTGADRLKPGKVEMAEGGTLFLDEIGEMALDLQPKLLRFLEELVFYRVGGVRPIHADVRILAATNRDLARGVAEGRFRGDLLFRLNVMPIHLPPLRERIEDVRPLINHFGPLLAARLGKPFQRLDDAAWALLETYPWPGNVRELRHSLERALILSDDGVLHPEHFQLMLPTGSRAAAGEGVITDRATQDAGASSTDNLPAVLAAGAPLSLADAEAAAIRQALNYCGGNRLRAAEILKIHRNTLARKILDYKIEVE